MARSLSQVPTFTRHLSSLTHSSRLLSLRTQSNNSSSNPNDPLTDLTLSDPSHSSSDPLLSKLEDAIHRIIVRRSAPGWLPFVPGASYWVPPPRSQLNGIAHLVEELSNPPNPLTQHESVSSTIERGWPSSSYFILDHGASPHPVESDSTSENSSHSEDEEG